MTLVFAGLPSACVFSPAGRAFAPAGRAFALRAPFPPSGRYTRTNPLRREAGLRLLGESLPEPLRWSVLRLWRGTSRYSETPLEVPSQPPDRPDDATLFRKPPDLLACLALVEFEVARRVVETPQTSMLPMKRDALLSDHSAYLRKLYNVLALQIGEAAALAQFDYLIACIV